MIFSSVTKIDLSEDKLVEAILAYLCIIAMPLFYSIADGIAVGIISYSVIHLITGKGKKSNH